MVGFEFEVGLDTQQAERDIDKFANTASKKLDPLSSIPVDVDLTDFQKEIGDILKTAEGIKSEFKGIKLPTTQAGALAKEFNSLRSSASSAMNEQKNALAALISAGKKGSIEFEKLQKELIDNAKKAKIFGDSLKEVNDTIKQIDGKKVEIEFETQGDTSFFSGAKGQLAGLAGGAGIAAVGAGLFSAIEKADETNNAFKKLQVQTGVTGKEFEKLKADTKELYLAGVGENMTETANAIGVAKSQLGNFLKGDDLTAFTKRAAGLGKAFDKDVTEVISKARPFITQFGLSGEEASNLMAYGLQNAGSAGDDFLDTIDEYSDKISAAGISGAEFVGVLTNGIQAGFRNTDQLADAIKETGIRLRAGDISKSLKDIDSPIASQIASIVKLGEAGQLSVTEVLQKSSKLISESAKNGKITDATREQLQVALSGTLGEEVGGELYGKIFGAKIDVNAIKKKASEAGKVLDENLAPTGFEGFKRSLEGLLGTIGDLIFPILEPITKLLNEQIMPAITPIIKMLGGTLGKILGSTGELIGKTVVALMPLIEALLQIVDVALKPLSTIIEALTPVITELVGVFVSILVPILKDLTPLIGLVVQVVAQVVVIFAKVTVAVMNFYKSIVQAVAKLFGFNDAGEFMTVIIRKVINVVTWLVEKMFDFYKSIEKVIDGIIGFTTSIGKFLGIIDEKDAKSKKSAKANKELSDSEVDVAGALKLSNNELKDNNKNLNDNTAATGGATKQVETYAEKLERLRKELIQTKLAGKDFTKPQQKSLDELVKNAINTEKLNVATQQVDDLIKSLARLQTEGAFKLNATTLDTTVEEFKRRLKGTFEKDGLNIELKELKITDFEIDLTKFEDVKNEFDALGLNLTPNFDNQKAEDDSEEQLEILKEQLKSGEIEYSAYVDKIDELEKQRNENARKNNQDLMDITKFAFEAMSKTINTYIAKDLEGLKAGLQGVITKQITMTDFLKDNQFEIGQLVNKIGASLAVAGGQALAQNESVGKAVVKQAIGVAEQLIAIYSAEIFAYLSTLAPPPFGQILAGGVIASALALLAKAKSKIGAEDGVIGIDGSYNKEAGATDTIPLWVAKGESIINKKATDKNKKYLEFMNNGGSIDSLISQNVTIERGGMSSREIVDAIGRLESKLGGRSVVIKDSREVVVTDKRTIVKNLPYYR